MFLSLMVGVIFYWQASGEIYGVHKDLATAPPLPVGVVAIEVPESPDKIIWPVPPGQTKGQEKWSAVDLVTKKLIVKPRLVIKLNPDTELEDAIKGATTLQELKDALLGKTRGGRVIAGPNK